jgi:hypothetical protein
MPAALCRLILHKYCGTEFNNYKKSCLHCPVALPYGCLAAAAATSALNFDRTVLDELQYVAHVSSA